VSTVASVAPFYRCASCVRIVRSVSRIVLVSGRFTQIGSSAVPEYLRLVLCYPRPLERSFGTRLVGAVQWYMHSFGCSCVLTDGIPPGLRTAVDRLHVLTAWRESGRSSTVPSRPRTNFVHALARYVRCHHRLRVLSH
jgi:hypothetical protein